MGEKEEEAVQTQIKIEVVGAGAGLGAWSRAQETLLRHLRLPRLPPGAPLPPRSAAPWRGRHLGQFMPPKTWETGKMEKQSCHRHRSHVR